MQTIYGIAMIWKDGKAIDNGYAVNYANFIEGSESPG